MDEITRARLAMEETARLLTSVAPYTSARQHFGALVMIYGRIIAKFASITESVVTDVAASEEEGEEEDTQWKANDNSRLSIM